MKETIPCLYAEYGRYINRFRAIPYYIDALKPVERRLLISLYHTARSDFTKSAKVIGHCIANYHPHGDQSAYESLVGLVHRGFAIGQGNWGSKYGLNEIPPAAMRYTRVKLSDSIRSLFEELLYYVKYEEFEMESEPVFLPSPIPLGLIGDNVITGISFYSTKIPQYDFKDLIERLKYILGIRDEIVIRPNFKDCMIEDVRNGIKKILSKGEGTIRLIPKYEIESKNLIIIGKPRIYGFSRLIRVCDNMKLSVIDNSKTKHGTRIIVEGGASSEDIVKKIIDSISYEIKFSCYFVDDTGNARIFGIDDILRKCIDSYKDTTINYLKDQLHILKEKKEDIRIIKIIRDFVSTDKRLYDLDSLISRVKSKYHDIDESRVRKVCNKYSISSMIKYKHDEESVTKEIEDIESKLNNIDKTITNIIIERLPLLNL